MIHALLVLLLLAFSGCALDSRDDRWQPEYDGAWAAATDCWQYTPRTRPFVLIREDCFGTPGRFPISTCGYAYGMYDPSNNLVHLCPDLAAMDHEFSHAVLYAKTGSAGRNKVKGESGGCYGVMP